MIVRFGGGIVAMYPTKIIQFCLNSATAMKNASSIINGCTYIGKGMWCIV